jgi:tetratricopeptide (TPR) repeat protein
VERLQLASTPQILAFAVVFMGMLALVVPTSAEFAELASNPSADAYSVAYLHALTRASQDDAHIRIAYVAQLAMLGRYDQALLALEPALHHAETAETAKNLRFDLLLARARSLPPSSDAREHAFEDVVGMLPEIVTMHQPLERLDLLARTALELERPGLAAGVYLRMADLEPNGERAARLSDAGVWFRAAGDGRSAARAFERAVVVEEDDHRAEDYALQALSSLEAADAACEASDRAGAYASRWSRDPTMLRRAVQLATACGRPGVARDLGRALLALAGDDDDETFAQVRRELANHDARAALPLVQKLVRRYPADANLREIEGHVAEWAGHPDLALGDWLFLIGHPTKGAGRFRLR